MPPGGNPPSPTKLATDTNTAALEALTAAVLRASGTLDSPLGRALFGDTAVVGGSGKPGRANERLSQGEGLTVLMGRLFGAGGANAALRARDASNVRGTDSTGAMLTKLAVGRVGGLAMTGARLGAGVGGPAGMAAGAAVGTVAEGFKKMVSPVTALIGLFGKVAGALSAAAVLGAALGSETSGFSIFMESIKLVGTVIGALMLPFFVVLAAAGYAVAEMLMGSLLPVLGDYYDLIIGTAMDAVDILSAAFETAKTLIVTFAESVYETGKAAYNGIVTALDAVYKAVNDFVNSIPGARQVIQVAGAGAFGAAGLLPGLANKLSDAAGGGLGKSVGELFQTNLDRSRRDRAAGGGDSFAGKFGEGLSAALQELRMRTGPKAQSMGIAQASRQAQMAALNMSPFEAKMLEFQNKILGALEESVARQRKPSADN